MTCEAALLEKQIQDFVLSSIGERVSLRLGIENKVAINSTSRHGSTVLGMFWVKVFQHHNNYPVHRYPYRRLYKAGGKYLVCLQVDTVTITVCLETGGVAISGEVSLDWFVTRFSGIMEAYRQPAGHSRQLKDPFDAEQKRFIKHVRKQILRRRTEQWPQTVVDDDLNVLDASQILRQQQVEAASSESEEGALTLEPLLGEKPSGAYHLDNLLSPASLDSELQRLTSGVMVDGARLYAVWTSLLHRWLSNDNTVVTVVTPAIDTPTLQRLCHLVLNHRTTAHLHLLATPLRSRCGQLADIRRDVMATLPTEDRVFAEYKVYNAMVFPWAEFQAKFIAGKTGDSVEVLLTSAEAESRHLSGDHSSMALFQTLSAADFDSRLLAPIVASLD